MLYYRRDARWGMPTERTPANVFRLLADEIRLDILRAIAREQHGRDGVGRLAFSEIYDRVDVDNTSKLSYHLGELTGTFLRKQDDAYAFTHAGEQLTRFVLAENHRAPPEIEPIETPGRCLHCDEASLQATRNEQFFTIICAACDRPSFVYVVTPAQLRSHEGDALVDAVTWDNAADILKVRNGVCPSCAGRMESSVRDVRDHEALTAVPATFAADSVCQECLRYLSLPLTHVAAYHTESIAFHWDRGIDILESGPWRLHQHLHDGRWTAERTAEDPARYRVALDHDNATLRFEFDDHAQVQQTERVERRSA